ncbi:MAG: TetR/AcrR family transcriptional regulator [Bacilli bacterium]
MPRNQLENERLKKLKKESILNAALYEFAFRGYSGATVDDISKRANITRSLFYHYFKDKEDAFLTLLDKTTEEITNIFNTIDLNKQIIEVFDDMISLFINILTSEEEALSCTIYMLLNLYFEKEYLPKINNKVPNRTNIFAFVNDIVTRGINEKLFIDVPSKELTISFLSMMKGFAFNRIIVGKESFICPRKEIIKNLFLRKERKYEQKTKAKK